jgi:hypothetical protein
MIADIFSPQGRKGKEATDTASRQISKRTLFLPSLVKIARTLRDLL